MFGKRFFIEVRVIYTGSFFTGHMICLESLFEEATVCSALWGKDTPKVYTHA